LKREIQNVITLNTTFTHQSWEEKAQDTVYNFLTKVDGIDSLIETMTEFNSKIVSIQRKFRTRRERLKAREQVISGYIWEREIGYLTRVFQKKKKGEKVSKKQTRLCNKMMVIPREVKERIL